MFIQWAWTRFKKYSNIHTKGSDQVQQSFKYSLGRLVSGIIYIFKYSYKLTPELTDVRKSTQWTWTMFKQLLERKRNQTSLSQGIITESEKRQKKKLLIDYLYANLKNHNFWAYRYFFCEFLGILNVVGALFFYLLIQFSLSSMWSVRAKHTRSVSISS